MRAQTATGEGRTIHIKCVTWVQVEAFMARKLRRGNLLTAKLPFAPDADANVTVALELPNQVIFSIEAQVRTVARMESAERWWVELELTGFTAETQQRLRASMAHDSARPARVSRPESVVETQEVPIEADERTLFQQLTTELRRVRAAPAHEVLGVEIEASAKEAKRAWLHALALFHPDAVAHYRNPALTHLAEEISIQLNRALARFATTVRASSWLIGFEELGTGEIPVRGLRRRQSTAPVSSTTEAVEARAKALLADGNIEAAQEHLAGALLAFPRARPLRVLYYVCGALRALEHGEREFARSQLDAALSHDRTNPMVAGLLERLRLGMFDTKGLRKLFE